MSASSVNGVSGVNGSQLTNISISPVKEQTKRSTSQPRTPDTLKSASSSCSFRHCFTRIYDFFCALFRCLFCIKDKPSKPEKEENEPTEQPERSKQSIETSPEQPLQQTPGEPAPEPDSEKYVRYLKRDESQSKFKELSFAERINVLKNIGEKAPGLYHTYFGLHRALGSLLTGEPSAENGQKSPGHLEPVDFTDSPLLQLVSGDESQTPLEEQPFEEQPKAQEPPIGEKAELFLQYLKGKDKEGPGLRDIILEDKGVQIAYRDLDPEVRQEVLARIKTAAGTKMHQVYSEIDAMATNVSKNQNAS